MIDVVAIGELLIDFTPGGYAESGSALYERNPGGAPANVLAAIAKLGKKTAFIGKVGNDSFGHYLATVLEDLHIESKGLVYSDAIPTTLAVVGLDKSGERSFHFYRKPGADVMLEESELDYSLIENAKILHFGSISMTDEPSRTATLSALEYAKAKGVIISYDPNLRPALWSSMEEAKEKILHAMKYADILKISEEELEFITGTKELEAGTLQLLEQYNIGLIFVTLGANGCFYRRGGMTGLEKGYVVEVVDTTGAGDSFIGGALFQMMDRGKQLHELNEEDMRYILSFANAVGALTTTKKGAIPAMPSINQVNELTKIR